MLSGDDSRSYYQILGVSREATLEDLRLAHRQLALVLHPDRHARKPENERNLAGRRMREINEAWSVLCDQAQRTEYDRQLVALELGRLQPHGGGAATGEHPTTAPGQDSVPADADRAHDEFSDMYEGRRTDGDGRPPGAVFFDAREEDLPGWQHSLLRRGPIVSMLLVAMLLFLITAYAGSVRDADPGVVATTQIAAKKCASRLGAERAATRVPCSEPNDGQIVAKVETPLDCPAKTSYVVIDNDLVCIGSDPAVVGSKPKD